MCSSYWNLKDVKFTCPKCGADAEDTLQTHYMGDVQSCTNYYRVGEPVDELLGIEGATLGPTAKGYPDDFIGNCDDCGTFIDFAARIVNGAVIRVWPYQWHEENGRRVPVAASR